MVHEYAASEIKVAVVGYGQATKDQVQCMVASLLKVAEKMVPDASDALAAAICDLHRQYFQSGVRAGDRDAIPVGAAANVRRLP
jgi:crossover junction endodeoxyribonuclease RuvC